MRAKDKPQVFDQHLRVTFDPTRFLVFLGMLSPEKKSFAVASFGSLRDIPFTNAVKNVKSNLLIQRTLKKLKINIDGKKKKRQVVFS
jgi:hypothetical protein